MKGIRTGWKSWKAIVLGFVAVALGGFFNKGWSEDLPPPAQSTTTVPTNSLEQRISILERKLEIAQGTSAEKAKETVSVNAGTDGFRIQSANKDFVLKLRVFVQGDSRFFLNGAGTNAVDQFLVRRARPILEGSVFNYASFRLTPDLAGNGKTTLFDAYMDIAPWTFAKLRVGKFKPPIGLEHLQSDEYLAFAERGLTSDLVPSRDTGVQLFGDLWNGAFGYAAALTNGVGDNNVNTVTTPPVASDGDVNDGKEVTARVAAKPFKNSDRELVQGLGVGFAASYAKKDTTSPTYVTPGQINIFTPTATAADYGSHTRLAPEANWYYRSLGLFGEFVQSSQVWGVGTGAVRSFHRVNNQAWQAAASYVVTGEDASYSGVKPRQPFDLAKGTWGALEVATRYAALHLDPRNLSGGITTFSSSIQTARAYGLGVNWYLNNAVRFTTDYEQTQFKNGAVVGDRPNEKVLISRWQLIF